MHSNSLLINRKNTLGRAQLNIVSWKRRMDLREFYQDFVTQWYSGDTSSDFVRKCRLLLEEEAEFFESTVQEVKSYEDPYESYNMICDGIFADGQVHMGRLLALFAISVVLVKIFPDIQELLVAQLKKRQVDIEKLTKCE